jgi:hypothetical protein
MTRNGLIRGNLATLTRASSSAIGVMHTGYALSKE